MNIDEMKDRIARAEEIQRYTENRCEVLEKENAELKAIVRNTKAVDESFTKLQQENKVLAQNLEDTEIVNKALEKENAELKAKLKEHESIGNAQFWENVWAWKTKADQLTKAKEIIKNLMVYVPVDLKEYEEAEQFLKDCSE